jgi:hypothetical protein
MASLHKEGATFFTKWLMQAHVRTSDPRAGGVSSMLILKYTIDHKDFFATVMLMGIEVSLRRPTN